MLPTAGAMYFLADFPISLGIAYICGVFFIFRRFLPQMLGRPPLYALYLPQLGEKKKSLSSIFLRLNHQDPDI